MSHPHLVKNRREVTLILLATKEILMRASFACSVSIDKDKVVSNIFLPHAYAKKRRIKRLFLKIKNSEVCFQKGSPLIRVTLSPRAKYGFRQLPLPLFRPVSHPGSFRSLCSAPASYPG
jgi:hypothetical protein